MALENLTPENRVERLLSGADLEPATRLEYFLKQAGSGGGSGLPEYDDEDIGKVLTVGSEYETTGEAIQTQSVGLVDGVGTLDAQKVDASNWTVGQLVSVVFNGTTYVLEIADIEGSLTAGNVHFHLYYHSNTGVMTIEALDAESPVTVSAQYLTEHANADWAEPSGGSGTALYIQVVSGAPGVSEHLNRTYDEIDTAIANEQAIMVKTAGENSFLFLLYAINPLPNKYIVRLFDVGDQIVLNYTADTADGQLVLAEEGP